ncbi:dynamin family protein [Aquifex pyrophilus]
MKYLLDRLNNIKEVTLQLSFLAPFTEQVEELEQKLFQGKLNVAFVGEFNSGKSSLINALFGLELPTNVLPETASIWRIRIRKVERPKLFIKSIDDEVSEVVSFEEAKMYSPDRVKYIDVFTNGEIDEGITIIDTPGLSSLKPLHREILENFIEDADVLLIIVDVNQGLTKSLKNFIENSLKEKRKTYAVITKTDTKPEEAVENLSNYIRKVFADFVEDVITTSAKEGRIEELKKLLEEISEQKEAIVSESVERKLRYLCKDMLTIVTNQIKNAELNTSDLEIKMREIKKNIEETEKLISQKQDEIEEQIKRLSEKAAAIFINSLKGQVDWIVEALYDEDLKESIENRFDKAIKIATQDAMKDIEKEVEGILKDVEFLASELGRKHDIGKNISIIITEFIVEIREALAEFIYILISRIPTTKPFAKHLGEVIRIITTAILKPLTKQFVKSKVKKAIENPELELNFINELQKSLNEFITKSISGLLEDLERSKQSYELAYKEILEERHKKIEEFNHYIEKLKEAKLKLMTCGGEA